MSSDPARLTRLSVTEDAALRDLSRGPLRPWPDNRTWQRTAWGTRHKRETLQALERKGYAVIGDITVKLSPAGFDAVRARGFLPVLSGLVRASQLEGASQ